MNGCNRRNRGIGWMTPVACMGLMLPLVAASLPWPDTPLIRSWDRSAIVRAQVRCLNERIDPATVVYEESPEAAAALIEQCGYTELEGGAAGWISPHWSELMRTMGQGNLSSHLPGATVFLHERWTPSGERLLVHASYRPSPRAGGRGELDIRLLGVDAFSELPVERGHFVLDDFLVFHLWARPVIPVLPHPSEHTLRVFAGQATSADPSAFHFDCEIDGLRRTVRVRILCGESEDPGMLRIKVRTENGN